MLECWFALSLTPLSQTRLIILHPLYKHTFGNNFQTGMRNYYNGGSTSSGATPPPGVVGGRAGSTSSSSSLFMGAHGGPRRSASTSLPRSPDPNELGNFGGPGSVSSQESSKQDMYQNVYQNIPSHTNTSNHSSLFVSDFCLVISSCFPIQYNTNCT